MKYSKALYLFMRPLQGISAVLYHTRFFVHFSSIELYTQYDIAAIWYCVLRDYGIVSYCIVISKNTILMYFFELCNINTPLLYRIRLESGSFGFIVPNDI